MKELGFTLRVTQEVLVEKLVRASMKQEVFLRTCDSIVTLYLTYWGKQYEKKTGKEVTDEVYSKIHNGGPNGWNKESTEKYWKKVKELLYDKKRNHN